MGLERPCLADFGSAVVRVPVTEEKVAKEIIDREFDPEIHKMPVSKEYMACVLGGKIIEDSPIVGYFSDAIYDSISGMLFKLARKYSVTNGFDDVNDLVNSCVERIFKMMHHYNPKKATFNTWAWIVASSVLNRRHVKNKRYRERFTVTDEFDANICSRNTEAEVNDDIRLVVGKLFNIYPEHEDILFELFYHEGEIHIPDKISLRSVAAATDRKYGEVYYFVCKKVRTFLKDNLGGEK